MRRWVVWLILSVSVLIAALWGFLQWRLSRAEHAVWVEKDPEKAEAIFRSIEWLGSRKILPERTRARVSGLKADLAFHAEDFEQASKLYREEFELLQVPAATSLESIGELFMPNTAAAEFAEGFSDYVADESSFPAIDDSDLLPPEREPLPESENAHAVLSARTLSADFLNNKYLPGRPDEWKDSKILIATLVAENSEALTTLRNAAELQGWRTGTRLDQNAPNLAHLAALEFVYRCQTGDSEAAAESFALALRTLDFVKDEPDLISLLTYVSFRSSLIEECLQGALTQFEFSDPALAKISAALAERPFDSEFVGDCAGFEYREINQLIESAFPASASADVPSILMTRMVQRENYEFWVEARKYLSDVDGEDWFQRPDQDSLTAEAYRAQCEFFSRFRPSLYGARHLTAIDGQQAARAQLEALSRTIWIMLAPSLGRLRGSTNDAITSENAIRASIAILRFEARENRLPEDLAELRPDFLTEPPVDVRQQLLDWNPETRMLSGDEVSVCVPDLRSANRQKSARRPKVQPSASRQTQPFREPPNPAFPRPSESSLSATLRIQIFATLRIQIFAKAVQKNLTTVKSDRFALSLARKCK